MTKRSPIATALALFLFVASGASADEWTRLPSIPDREGVAGAFAGTSGGALVVAGGANFPDKKPWEGGKKVWHDEVYVLERPDGEWKLAGKLPRPLAYGVSATLFGGGVVCVGGSDAEKHYSDCFRLDWLDGKLVVRELPPLPMPLANACGAMLVDTLIVAGGQERPDSTEALKSVWAFGFGDRERKWRRLEDLPGEGRILAAAAEREGNFYVFGGASLKKGADGVAERTYLRDAYRYVAFYKWTRLADLPSSSVAAPSPCPVDLGVVYLLGGDDGSQVGIRSHAHRGFSKSLLRYDSAEDRWDVAGEIPAPRVTVPCVRAFDAWVIPSGEMRPGVRSPEVWSFAPEPERP